MSWDTLFGERVWGKYPSEELVRYVCGNQIKGRALEIGCGVGANLWFLAKEGLFVDGLDGSKSALIRAKELMAEMNVSYGELINADFTKYDYDKKYDLIVDVEALYCVSIDEARETIKKLHGVLNNGGRLYSQTFRYTPELFNGDCVGYNAFISTSGALEGKGFSRFTSYDNISDIYGVFSKIEIGTIERNQTIKEWIITCEK